MLLKASLFRLFPFLLTLCADSGYQRPKFQHALSRVCQQVNVEIVKCSDAGRFVLVPKRWIVERTNCLAEPMPPARQGLGAPEPQRASVPTLGVGQTHAAKGLSSSA